MVQEKCHVTRKKKQNSTPAVSLGSLDIRTQKHAKRNVEITMMWFLPQMEKTPVFACKLMVPCYVFTTILE